jgi:hypothetical protein
MEAMACAMTGFIAGSIAMVAHTALGLDGTRGILGTMVVTALCYLLVRKEEDGRSVIDNTRIKAAFAAKQEKFSYDYVDTVADPDNRYPGKK